MLFVLESIPQKNRGLLGGLLWAMTGVGMVLGSFAATMVNENSAYDWAWRIPFLLGIVTGGIAYFLRRNTPESTLFEKAKRNHTLAKFPLWLGIVKYKREMLVISCLYVLSAMITYLIFIFMPTYAANIFRYAVSDYQFN